MYSRVQFVIHQNGRNHKFQRVSIRRVPIVGEFVVHPACRFDLRVTRVVWYPDHPLGTDAEVWLEVGPTAEDAMPDFEQIVKEPWS